MACNPIFGLSLTMSFRLRWLILPAAKQPPKPIPAISTEQDLYAALGLDFVVPELREETGEIEAAEAGKLPKLIELSNLRGTFHAHTSTTDGRNTLEEMAAAARDLGLQYLGMSDHSKSSFQAHGLTEEKLLQQVKAIQQLNAGFNGEFWIFAGVECDI